MKVQIYSDGGARGNPGPAAVGIIICTPEGEILQEHHEVIGESTNNVAEYTAVLVGLEIAKNLGAEEIDYYLDSELVAKQLTGRYRVKTPHIQALFRNVREKASQFGRVSFAYLPRTHEKIRYVDRLVNQALNLAGH